MAIPLPKSGWEAFDESFNNSNNALQKIFQGQLEKQKLKELARQHQQDYALRQQANARLQQLQPYQIALLKAKAGSAESNAAWNNMLLGGGQGMPNAGQGGNPNNQGAPQPNPQQYDALKNMMQQNFQGQGALRDESQMQQGQPNDQMQQPPQQMQNPEQEQNQVHVLHEGNPQLAFADRFAGIKGIPPAQTHYDNNGNLVTRYPSGRVTIEKVAPSATEQKANEQLNAQNAKDVHEYEQQLPTSVKLLEKIDKSLKIIPKHKKDWFGPGVLGIDFLGGPKQRKRGITDPDYGVVEGLLGQLVGPQAKDLSGNRILATALGLAQDIKPGFGENYEIAYGKLKQIRDELASSINTQSGLYHKAGGKNQYKVPEFKEDTGTTLLIGKNGEQYDVPSDKVDRFLQKHKDLKRG